MLAHQAHALFDLVALGLPTLGLKVDEFGHVQVCENSVAASAATSRQAQCLHEAHQVIEAHIGGVSTSDSSKKKAGLHGVEVTEPVRQDLRHGGAGGVGADDQSAAAGVEYGDAGGRG